MRTKLSLFITCYQIFILRIRNCLGYQNVVLVKKIIFNFRFFLEPDSSLGVPFWEFRVGDVAQMVEHSGIHIRG